MAPCAKLAACTTGPSVLIYQDVLACAGLLYAAARLPAQAVTEVLAESAPFLVPATAVDCLQGASSCGAVRACVTPGQCSVRGATRCDGDVVAWCGPGLDQTKDDPKDTEWRFSCRGLGLTCRSFSGYAVCVDAATCAGTFSRCDGDTLVACEGGLGLHEDCSRLGLGCGLVGGQAQCVGKGAACTEDSDHCADQGTLVQCTGGAEWTTDCALLDQTCGVSDQVGSAAHCERGDLATPTCANNALTLTTQKGTVRRTCASLGLVRCLDEGRCGF